MLQHPGDLPRSTTRANLNPHTTPRLTSALMPHITTPKDPRLAPFIAMRDRDLRREAGLCLAEGEHLVRRAFEAGLKVRSVLVVEHKADRVAAMLGEHAQQKVGWASRPSSEPSLAHDGRDAHPTKPTAAPYNQDVEILTCTKALLADAVGFDLHQGIIAAVEPPAAWDGLEGLARAVQHAEDQGTPMLLVCPEVTNAENLGLLARVAAGLGVGAMVLGPRCADPWTRRAARTSMGAVFTLPIVRLTDDDPSDAPAMTAGLNALRQTHHYTLIATVTDEKAPALHHATLPHNRKPAILLGSEGYGLPPETIAHCDQQVRIPMYNNTDSLNIAIAAGIVVYHFSETQQTHEASRAVSARPPHIPLNPPR